MKKKKAIAKSTTPEMTRVRGSRQKVRNFCHQAVFSILMVWESSSELMRVPKRVGISGSFLMGLRGIGGWEFRVAGFRFQIWFAKVLLFFQICNKLGDNFANSGNNRGIWHIGYFR